MARDYSNDLTGAIRDEQIETLRNSVDGALSAAAGHRKEAERHQNVAKQELHFAARDDERARQWQQKLDALLAEQTEAAELAEARAQVEQSANKSRFAIGQLNGIDCALCDCYLIPGCPTEVFFDATFAGLLAHPECIKRHEAAQAAASDDRFPPYLWPLHGGDDENGQPICNDDLCPGPAECATCQRLRWHDRQQAETLSTTPLAVAFGAIPLPRDGEQADGGEQL